MWIFAVSLVVGVSLQSIGGRLSKRFCSTADRVAGIAMDAGGILVASFGMLSLVRGWN
jgi:hypothetical protein